LSQQFSLEAGFLTINICGEDMVPSSAGGEQEKAIQDSKFKIQDSRFKNEQRGMGIQDSKFKIHE
jgi:hypothetical protein